MFTIYTKKDCRYCKLAKEFIQKNSIDDYTEILLDPENKDHYDDVVNRLKTQTDHHTFPFIFKDEKFIGGYTDLVSHVDLSIDDEDF